MMFMTFNKRETRNITAAQAFRTPGISFFARAIKGIPVERHGDVERKNGRGTIVAIKDNKIQGNNTKFTRLTVGSSIFLENEQELKIKEIISNIEIEVEEVADQLDLNMAYGYKLKPDYHRTYS